MNWITEPLGNICDTSSGGTPNRKDSSNYLDGEIPWVKSGELKNCTIFTAEETITKKGLDNSSAKIFPAGTLLIALYGANIGKLAFLGIEAATNQAVCGLFQNSKVRLDYLYYYLFSQRDNLVRQGIGGAQPNISQTILKKLMILHPISLESQQEIVNRIEELFSELDKGVETLMTIKKQLEVYRQAVLKNAFMTPYPRKKLEELCYFITKGTTPPKSKMQSDGEIPFIKVYNLTFTGLLDFSIDPTYVPEEIHRSFLGRSIVYPGDVLMNIVGPPMGKVSIVPSTFIEWNINQAIARFRCGENLSNKYLAHFLSFEATVESMKSKSKATAGQFNLTLEICRNIEIPLPCISEQLRIVSLIESQLSVCESISNTVNTALEQAESMRKSILKQAFEGRLI